ncbi:MAG: PHP domain-containing protein [Actinomycetota bacterium]
MLIDLHTHSQASDGTDTPTQLIEKAINRRLDVIALTDHDTTRGWDEATSALLNHPSNSPLQLVHGAEISCQDSEGISIHMLGLFFDPGFKPLMDVLEQTRENRVSRMERIIARLNEAGIEITIEDVHAQRTGDATLGRPHLADALVARGHVTSRDEAFAALLHNKSKFYINHYSPSPSDAINLIKQAGGVAVIAHPLASQRGRTIRMEVLDDLISAGLDGIEVRHRDHSEDEKSQLLRLAIEKELIVTGSSDYHGTGKQNQLAEFTTHPQQWEALVSRASSKNVAERLIRR